MTASIKDVKTSYVTVKTTSKTKKLKAENKEQLNQQETLEAKIRPERQVEKGTKDGIVFGRDADGQSNGVSVLQELQEQEEAIAGRLLSQMTGKQRKEDLDGRDRLTKTLSGAPKFT